MWLLFQTFVIFGSVYWWQQALVTPNDPNNGYGLALIAGFSAWFATWLLSRALDAYRRYFPRHKSLPPLPE